MASALPSLFVALAGVCLALVLFQLWQSLRVLLARSKAPRLTSGPSHAGRAALMREKDELLTAIRDVRSEHELGKLSAADSQQLEQRYRVRAREVLRHLDEQLAPHRERARAMLEEAVPSGSVTASAASGPGGAQAAPGDSDRVKCSKCGSNNDPDAVFCKKCGARVAAGDNS